MGQSASQPGALQRLPDPVDEATAMAFAGKCFGQFIFLILFMCEAFLSSNAAHQHINTLMMIYFMF